MTNSAHEETFEKARGGVEAFGTAFVTSWDTHFGYHSALFESCLFPFQSSFLLMHTMGVNR